MKDKLEMKPPQSVTCPAEPAQLGVEKSVRLFSPGAAARSLDPDSIARLQIDIRLARQRRSSLATDKNIAAHRARAAARQSIRRNLPPLGQQAHYW
jgi:hypothetical protein